MTQRYFYKVKYGYGVYEFARIEAGPDLERVIYAWGEKIPVTIGGRMIAGRSIISIEPDFHKYTGWYDTYQPMTADDMKQIERDCPPQEDFYKIMDAAREKVVGLIAQGRTDLIGAEDDTKKLGEG